MSFFLYPLEVSFHANNWDQVGIVMFYIAIVTIIIAALSLFLSLILALMGKNYSKTLKVGLIFFLIAGASLLLTSIFCGWYR